MKENIFHNTELNSTMNLDHVEYVIHPSLIGEDTNVTVYFASGRIIQLTGGVGNAFWIAWKTYCGMPQ